MDQSEAYRHHYSDQGGGICQGDHVPIWDTQEHYH
jgi:hypothetical protein